MIDKTPLKLSDIYMITGENPKDEEAFLYRLATCLQKGVSLIQLRANQLSENEYRNLAKKALALCHQYNAKLLFNTNVEIAKELNADGIQLNSERLLKCHARPIKKTKIVAASCHNEQELLQAEKIGVDFVTLSPVLPTTTHPGANHLGWENFSILAPLVSIPIFALGGVGIKDLPIAKKNGAYGIAAISALWGD